MKTIGIWCIAATAALSPGLQAQEAFPKHAVTIVVPYSAGGVTDLLARAVSAKLGKAWGQPVVVDNRPGGGSIIGTQQVSRAPADGYTLLFASYGFTSNPILRKNLPYSVKVFRPVALLGSSHNVLLVTNRLKKQSLQTMIAQAKAQPGSLKLASSGLGSSPHVGAEFFVQKTGLTYTHVPYKGQGPAMTDLISGVVDGMFDGMSSYAQVKSGNVGAVAIAAEHRHPAAPDLPTFKELGVDFVSGTWFGLLAPAGVSDAVVAKINHDMRKALQEDDLKAQIAKTGLSVTTSTPEAFGQFLEQESSKLQKLIDQGAKIDLQ